MSTQKNWPSVKLKDVLTGANRWEKTVPGVPYRQVGVRLWGEGAYERETVDGATTKYNQLNRVEIGDVIVNKIWARNGSVSVIDALTDGCYCSNEFPLYCPDRKQIESRWLFWMTKTRWFWASCDKQSFGTSGKNRIRPEKFLEIEIPLPPLSEQRRLVSRLDDLIGKARYIQIQHQESSIEIDSLLLSVFDRITQKTNKHSMGEIAPLVRRPVEVDFTSEYWELGVRSFGKGTFHKPALSGSDVGTKRIYWIEPGDLVLSNVFAWEGAIAVAKPEDTGRVGSHRFISRVAQSGVTLPEFLCFYLLTTEGIEKIRAASPGGAGRNRTLGLSKLDDITVPIPVFEKQQHFVQLMRSCAKARTLQTDIDTDLTALVPSLLDKAFKGEL